MVLREYAKIRILISTVERKQGAWLFYPLEPRPLRHDSCITLGPNRHSLRGTLLKYAKFWCLSLDILTWLSQATVIVVQLLLGGGRGGLY